MLRLFVLTDDPESFLVTDCQVLELLGYVGYGPKGVGLSRVVVLRSRLLVTSISETLLTYVRRPDVLLL